jgi:hypothetical protein
MAFVACIVFSSCSKTCVCTTSLTDGTTSEILLTSKIKTTGSCSSLNSSQNVPSTGVAIVSKMTCD